jgi:hypothetical protein
MVMVEERRRGRRRGLDKGRLRENRNQEGK